MLATVIAVLGVVAALVASGVAVLAFRTARSRTNHDDMEEMVKRICEAARGPVMAKLDYLAHEVDELRKVPQKVDELTGEVIRLKVKVDVFWEGLAKDIARMLASRGGT